MNKSIAQNKSAIYNYFILETLDAGLVLTGPEVKSIKNGQINIRPSYIKITPLNQIILVNAHISPYRSAAMSQKNYTPTQERCLLLRKKEIRYLTGKIKEAGITIIPLEIYLKNNLIKIKIGICRGKKKYDKREALKKKDFKRRKDQLIKHY